MTQLKKSILSLSVVGLGTVLFFQNFESANVTASTPGFINVLMTPPTGTPQSVAVNSTVTVARLVFDNSKLNVAAEFPTHLTLTYYNDHYKDQSTSVSSCVLMLMGQSVPITTSPVSVSGDASKGKSITFLLAQPLVIPASSGRSSSPVMVNVVCQMQGIPGLLSWGLNPTSFQKTPGVEIAVVANDPAQTPVTVEATGNAGYGISVVSQVNGAPASDYTPFQANDGQPQPLTYCFTPLGQKPTGAQIQIDTSKVPFSLFRYPSAPPRSNSYQEAYDGYPLTASASSALHLLNASTATYVVNPSQTFQKYFYLAANASSTGKDDTGNINDSCTSTGIGPSRCNNIPDTRFFYPDSDGNPTKEQIYARFSSPPAQPSDSKLNLSNADACTLAQEAWALGYPMRVINELTADTTLQVNVNTPTQKVVTYAELTAGGLNSPYLSTQYFINRHFVDVCVLPQNQMNGTELGVILDYEVHDGRSQRDAHGFLRKFANIAHKAPPVEGGAIAKAVLYTDPLNASGAVPNGLATKPAKHQPISQSIYLNELQAEFDLITIELYRSNLITAMSDVFQNQYNLLKGKRPVDPSHILITYELDGTTVLDAKYAHTLMINQGFKALVLWQHQGNLNGSCSLPVNKNILNVIGTEAVVN